jgi:hypothetical protein
MSVTEFAIRRWQLTLVLFTLLCALGYSAFTSIPRAVDPHFPLPVVVITAIQPGADAEEMEQTVAKPIEELMQGLEDVKEIVSTSNDSSTVIRAEFDWSGDPDRYFNDTVREVTAIRSRLPADLARLDFKKMRTTNASVLQIALVSETASWRRMEKYGRDISRGLFAICRRARIRSARAVAARGHCCHQARPARRTASARQQHRRCAEAGRRRCRRAARWSAARAASMSRLAGRSSRSTRSATCRCVRTMGRSCAWAMSPMSSGARKKRGSHVYHNGKRAIWITANQKAGHRRDQGCAMR